MNSEPLSRRNLPSTGCSVRNSGNLRGRSGNLFPSVPSQPAKETWPLRRTWPQIIRQGETLFNVETGKPIIAVEPKETESEKDNELAYQAAMAWPLRVYPPDLLVHQETVLYERGNRLSREEWKGCDVLESDNQEIIRARWDVLLCPPDVSPGSQDSNQPGATFLAPSPRPFHGYSLRSGQARFFAECRPNCG